MNCEVCGLGIFSDPPVPALHRVNPIGVLPGVWRCAECLTPEQDLAIGPEVREITQIIAGGQG